MKHFFFLLCFVTAIKLNGTAQNIHLVKDIDTITNGNPINNDGKAGTYAVLNGVSYFNADDGEHGKGLWRSDGTVAGTYQVKDSINPSNIIVSNGNLFFAGTGSLGLWKSDGTEAGTVPVLNAVPPGLETFVPTDLKDMNGTVYFSLSNPTTQLWKTNGTSAGTLLVKELNDPFNYSNSYASISNITVIKNKLYFNALSFSDFQSYRLFISDGSTGGTYLISNTIAGASQMMAMSPNLADPWVYFLASSSQYGAKQLYITNGSAGNAAVISGFSNFNFKSYETMLREGSALYFIGYTYNQSIQNQNLFKYDINVPNGPELIKAVTGTNNYGIPSSVSSLVSANGFVYFNVYDGPNNKSQFWKTTGTSAGNELVKDSTSFAGILNANGLLYFTGYDIANGEELWKSDGSMSGTTLVKDIHSGNKSSRPYALSFINNTVIFSADDGIHGRELWKSDGTSAGTSLLVDLNQTATSSSSPNGLKALNRSIIFSRGNDNNNELWRSDGTSNGTYKVSDTIFRQGRETVNFNNQAFFWGYSNSGHSGLYKTDGTASSTGLVKDFTGFPHSLIGGFSGDSLCYLILYTAQGAYDLWRTDGTLANTFLLKSNIFYSSNDRNMVSSGNNIFFVVNGGLWKSDGTSLGTVFLKTFTALTKFTSAGYGKIFFNGYDGENNIWKSDGTTIGTVKVTNNVTNAVPVVFTSETLFFTGIGNTGVYGNLGIELFKTDGTASGTSLLKDIVPGSANSSIYHAGVINSNWYFINYGSGGVELWKTNGTTSGTQFIYSFGNASLGNFITCNGKLFFTNGTALWESDGSTSGTHAFQDILVPDLTFYNNPEKLTSVGNQIYFSALSYKFGEELYIGNINGPAANDSITLCPNGSSGITSSLIGNSYQWQMDVDTGFVNLTNSSSFVGVTSSTLNVKNIPSSFSGAKFRCLVNGNLFSRITTLSFAIGWTGISDNSWENSLNWGCGGQIPNAGTDVFINYGQVIINSNVTCKSIKVSPGATFTVNPGFTLIITGL